MSWEGALTWRTFSTFHQSSETTWAIEIRQRMGKDAYEYYQITLKISVILNILVYMYFFFFFGGGGGGQHTFWASLARITKLCPNPHQPWKLRGRGGVSCTSSLAHMPKMLCSYIPVLSEFYLNFAQICLKYYIGFFFLLLGVGAIVVPLPPPPPHLMHLLY